MCHCVSSGYFYVWAIFGILHKYVWLLYELCACFSSDNLYVETYFSICDKYVSAPALKFQISCEISPSYFPLPSKISVNSGISVCLCLRNVEVCTFEALEKERSLKSVWAHHKLTKPSWRLIHPCVQKQIELILMGALLALLLTCSRVFQN